MESRQADAIKRVVDAFERSDWAEIDVRFGDVRVHLAVGSPGESGAAVSPENTARLPSPHGGATASTDTSDGQQTTGRGQTSDDPEIPAGAEVVIASSPGTFWRSPEPGAPPFAEVGDTVHASDTVCIIEVMKLMNHLKARVSGRVVAVYVENGVAVEKGAPLFAIVPVDQAP